LIKFFILNLNLIQIKENKKEVKIMDYKEFNRRKKEIFCNICCSDLLFDIIKKSNKDDFDDKIENSIFQLCELFSYVEQKKITETKISVLKFYRKINYIK